MMTLEDSLTDEERLIVDEPWHSLPDVDYPLSVGEMAAITGATERKIRSWADEGLLPSFREGNDRRFYSATLIRAFVLQRTPTHTKAVVTAAAHGEAAQAFQLLAATVGRAALDMPPQPAEQLTRLADELSSASRLMSDGWPAADAS
jgi:excisionase family DNA binding protein